MMVGGEMEAPALKEVEDSHPTFVLGSGRGV